MLSFLLYPGTGVAICNSDGEIKMPMQSLTSWVFKIKIITHQVLKHALGSLST